MGQGLRRAYAPPSTLEGRSCARFTFELRPPARRGRLEGSSPAWQRRAASRAPVPRRRHRSSVGRSSATPSSRSRSHAKRRRRVRLLSGSDGLNALRWPPPPSPRRDSAPVSRAAQRLRKGSMRVPRGARAAGRRRAPEDRCALHHRRRGSRCCRRTRRSTGAPPSARPAPARSPGSWRARETPPRRSRQEPTSSPIDTDVAALKSASAHHLRKPAHTPADTAHSMVVAPHRLHHPLRVAASPRSRNVHAPRAAVRSS